MKLAKDLWQANVCSKFQQFLRLFRRTAINIQQLWRLLQIVEKGVCDWTVSGVKGTSGASWRSRGRCQGECLPDQTAALPSRPVWGPRVPSVGTCSPYRCSLEGDGGNNNTTWTVNWSIRHHSRCGLNLRWAWSKLLFGLYLYIESLVAP